MKTFDKKYKLMAVKDSRKMRKEILDLKEENEILLEKIKEIHQNQKLLTAIRA